MKRMTEERLREIERAVGMDERVLGMQGETEELIRKLSVGTYARGAYLLVRELTSEIRALQTEKRLP